MLKISMVAAAAAALVAVASQAQASTFVGGYTVDANTTGLGLDVQVVPITTTLDFTLSAADPSTTINLFNLYTNASSVSLFDLLARPITIDFDFTAPSSFGGDIHGITDGFIQLVGRVNEEGVLVWGDGGETSFDFGNGGVLSVQLNDATFNDGRGLHLAPGAANGATISATFDWTDPSAGVPEPASWALMITGFGLAGAALRRRPTAQTVA